MLVDWVWPRGLKKTEAAVELCLKEIASSTELRKWFGRDPGKWQEFRKGYRAELRDNKELIDKLVAVAENVNLTLLFSARDREHNQAVYSKNTLKAVKHEQPR